MAAVQEVWRFPGICPNSWRQVRVLDPDPQMIFGLSMIQGYPLSGHHLQVPVALMSSVQIASQTPLMPFSTTPASLIVRNKEKILDTFLVYRNSNFGNHVISFSLLIFGLCLVLFFKMLRNYVLILECCCQGHESLHTHFV